MPRSASATMSEVEERFIRRRRRPLLSILIWRSKAFLGTPPASYLSFSLPPAGSSSRRPLKMISRLRLSF